MTLNTSTPFIKIKKRASVNQTVNREDRQPAPKQGMGTIQGKKAYSTEMMWARGLEAMGKSYVFQLEMPTAYTLPGQGKSIDFVVDGIWFDEIDGEIGHKTASQQQADAERDLLLDPLIKELGGNSIRRIDAMLFRDQKRVNEMVREYYR